MSIDSTQLLEGRYRGANPVATLLQVFRPDWGHLALAVLFFVLKHSPVWVLPWMTAHIIDLLNRPGGADWPALGWSAGILAVIIAQNVPSAVVYVRQLSIAVRNAELRLRSAIVRRLQHLSIGYYTRQSAGVLQTKLVRDVEAIEQVTRQLFEAGLSTTTNMIAAVIVTAMRAPGFLLFFVVAAPLAVLLVRRLRRPMERRNSEFRRQVERMSAQLMEITSLVPVTRAHSLEEVEIARADAQLAEVRAAGLELDGINALFGASGWVLLQLFSVLCLVTAAAMYWTQWVPITLGDVVMLTTYFTSITNALLGLVSLLPSISRGFESVRSIGEVLESPDLEQNEGKVRVGDVRGAYHFEDVSFSYPEGEAAALRGFTLEVRAGEVVALVGPSGAGKSTVLSMVIGFVRPSRGRLLLDDRDMNELDLRSVRRGLSVVPQDTILFHGSIRDNVAYGAPGLDDRRIWSALEAANAAEFVKELPQGIDTRVGERGARLSGGQKQRLAIARAILRDPRVLILDEATSALDTASERLVQEALGRLFAGRTTFIVAHRLSTIRHAHRIVVLDHGRIQQVGSHDALIAQPGLYQTLAQTQLR